MVLQVLINELSEPTDECPAESAIARLNGLVGAIRAARGIARDAAINAAAPIAQLAIATNWPLSVLRNRPECVDASTYIKTVVDSSPFTAALEERGEDAAGGAEYRLRPDATTKPGEVAVALGLAHDTDGLALSLPTAPLWQATLIGLDRSTLDAAGEIATIQVEARNACTAADVASHRGALEQAAQPAAATGAEMWERRADLFPNLRFIPRTRQQIEQLQAGTPTLRSIGERLRELDGAIAEWKRTARAQPKYPFSVTPESRRRLADVTFQDDAGFERVFSDHARYTPDEGRIHFILETEPSRHALIGHVGRKVGIG